MYLINGYNYISHIILKKIDTSLCLGEFPPNSMMTKRKASIEICYRLGAYII